MKKFEYGMPKNIKEVFTLLEKKNSEIKAGGVDLLDLMKEGIANPDRLVNIGRLKELHFLKDKGKEGLALGPNLTLSDLYSSKKISEGYRALAQAAKEAATPQIQNMATLGGNLCQRPRCWYYRSEDFHCARKGGSTCFAYLGENEFHAIFGNQNGCAIVHPSATANALMAFGAKVKIQSADGERTLSMEDFFVTPYQDITKENVLKKGELITEITLPPLSSNTTSYYVKQKQKQSFDWPLAEVAVVLKTSGKRCKEASIVLGSAAPIPWRAKKAEKVLQGQVITKDLAAKAGEAAVDGAQPMSQNKYKVQIFKTIVKRAICWAVGIDPLK